MKRKVLNFLFILCSFLLLSGKVFAEGETTSVDYTSICSKYAVDSERLSCCNQEPDEAERADCKKPVFNKCAKKETIAERYECCKQLSEQSDRLACNSLSEKSCPQAESIYVSKAASNIKIVYEPFEYKPDGFDDPKSSDYSKIYYWMDIKIYNMTSELYIEVNNGEIDPYKVTSRQINQDGVIVLRNSDTMNVRNFEFYIYSNRANCKDKLLRTIRLTLPKYNLYSSRTACEDIPEYYLCHQFINFDVDATNFLSNTEEYKAKLAKSNTAKSKDASKKVTSRKVLSSLSDNKYWVVGGILVIGVVATVFILRRRNG